MQAVLYALQESPSTRREWIEIQMMQETVENQEVSLHTEGVD